MWDMMNHIQRNRFIKLRDFLLKLKVLKFDFNKAVGPEAKKRKNQYPAPGKACALGWTPKVFPDMVKWHTFNSDCAGLTIVHAKKHDNENGSDSIDTVAGYLFGMTEEMIEAVFYPANLRLVDGKLVTDTENASWMKYGLDCLDAKATPKQVAANMDLFLVWLDRNKPKR